MLHQGLNERLDKSAAGIVCRVAFSGGRLQEESVHEEPLLHRSSGAKRLFMKEPM